MKKEYVCVVCGCKSKNGQIIDGIWHCNKCLFDNNFNFDEWMKLYKKNPDEFEKRRDKLIIQFIESSKNRDKLKKLQWKLDMIRRNKNPLKATIDFYYEMLDSFEKMRVVLNNFCKCKFDNYYSVKNNYTKIIDICCKK